ncbi:MAG: glycosyltransferase family 2 protein [Ignavibacteriaceae bacterium]|nr:glycosyltransferase family 2 protein [Ignavibacteriaceae bacterium]
MIKISSIIIAKNEEANISRCIESQLGCIDEIVIVVDDKSTDNTLEIVKSFTQVKYIILPWQGYSGTKNSALAITQNDWVLWIDADEALTPALKNELIAFKSSTPKFDVYSVPRIANFLGRWIKHSGWYPGRIERVFNKHKVKFSESNVHEHLVYSGNAGTFINNIEHYTDPSIFHYFEKYNRYTSLAAEEIFKKNKKLKISDLLIRPLFQFVKMYFFKSGFLDGIQGFILAVFSSAYVFTKYAKLWEIEKERH